MASMSPKINSLQQKEQQEVRQLLTRIYVSKASSSGLQNLAGQQSLNVANVVEKVINKVFEENNGQCLKQRQVEQLKIKLEDIINAQKIAQLMPQSPLKSQKNGYQSIAQSSTSLQLPPIVGRYSGNYEKKSPSPQQKQRIQEPQEKEYYSEVETDQKFRKMEKDYSSERDQLEKNRKNTEEPLQGQKQQKTLLDEKQKSLSLHTSPRKNGNHNRQRMKTFLFGQKDTEEAGLVGEENEKMLLTPIKLRQKTQSSRGESSHTHETGKKKLFVSEIVNTEQYLQRNRNDIWTLIAKYNDEKGKEDKREEHLKQLEKAELNKKNFDEQMKERKQRSVESALVEREFVKQARDEEERLRIEEEKQLHEKEFKKKLQKELLEGQLKEQKEERQKRRLQMGRDNLQIKQQESRDQELAASQLREQQYQQAQLFQGIKDEYFERYGRVEESQEDLNLRREERRRVQGGSSNIRNYSRSIHLPSISSLQTRPLIPTRKSTQPDMSEQNFQQFAQLEDTKGQQQQNQEPKYQQVRNQLCSPTFSPSPPPSNTPSSFSIPKSIRNPSKRPLLASEADKMFNLQILKEIDSYITTKKTAL